MDALFAKSWWEILLIFGGLGSIIFMVVYFLFRRFKPKKIKIGKVELDTNDNDEEFIKIKQLIKDEVSKDLVKDVKHVVSQTLLVGFEICKLKLVDIVNVQDQYTYEKLEGYNLFVKEQFIKLLCENPKYNCVENPTTLSESRLFYNVLRGYTEHTKKIFHDAFVSNNFRAMTESEFQDMIKRKKILMETVFEKYFADNYFEGLNNLALTDVTETLRNRIDVEFGKTVAEIFNYARQKKVEIEKVIELKRKELENYIKTNFNEDFSFDVEIEKKG